MTGKTRKEQMCSFSLVISVMFLLLVVMESRGHTLFRKQSSSCSSKNMDVEFGKPSLALRCKLVQGHAWILSTRSSVRWKENPAHTWGEPEQAFDKGLKHSIGTEKLGSLWKAESWRPRKEGCSNPAVWFSFVEALNWGGLVPSYLCVTCLAEVASLKGGQLKERNV